MKPSSRTPPSLAACAAALLAFTLTVAGCAARDRRVSGAYRYARLGRDDLLIPPLAKSGPAGVPTIILLKHARDGTRQPGACTFETHDFSLRWRGSAALIHVQLESLTTGADLETAPPPSFRQFEAELSKLEDRGCIARGAAAQLAERVIEHLPLSSRAGYYLRYGYYLRTGYIDLRPEFRLKVVSPILRAGATTLDAASILGWETAHYLIEPRPAPGGVRFALSSVEATVDGKNSPRTLPDYSRIAPPGDAGVYRLFFLAASGHMRRNITLVGERGLARLDALTDALGPGGDDLCDAVPAAFCMRFPTGTALSPELGVEAAGRVVYVPLGATVGDLLSTLPDKSPAGDLRISRVFEGKPVRLDFDRTSGDILQLVLVAGDQIRW